MKETEIVKASMAKRILAVAISVSASLAAWGCCNTCTIDTGAPRAYMEYTYTDCDGVMHSTAAYAGSGSATVQNCGSFTVTLVIHS